MAMTGTGSGRISYEVRGEGDPLLLIMGLAGGAIDWPPEFIDLLSPRFACITFDNRGCGSSDRATGEITIGSMAADAACVLDAVGADSAFVAGISMGGMIAQRMALDHADRVNRLVLIATHCGGPKAIAPRPDALALIGDPQPGREAMRRTMAGLSSPRLAERRSEALDAFVDRKLGEPTPFRVMQAQLGAIAADDRFDLLKKIEAETMVVTGDVDRLVPPENATTLAEGIPRARLHKIEECGHMVMLEHPEALAQAMSDFFTE